MSHHLVVASVAEPSRDPIGVRDLEAMSVFDLRVNELTRNLTTAPNSAPPDADPPFPVRGAGAAMCLVTQLRTPEPLSSWRVDADCASGRFTACFQWSNGRQAEPSVHAYASKS
jgi:hypothetical protein